MRLLEGLESHGQLEHLNDSAKFRIQPDARQGQNMAESTLQAVSDANFQVEVIDASKTQPVMVDFWADWCRPCHQLSPTVEEIAREHAGKLKVVKLNVDENINAAGKFNIRGIPTLLVFKGGQVVEQLVGYRSKDDITKALDRHVG